MKKVFVAIINQGWIKPELTNLLIEMSHSGVPIKIVYPALKPASENRNQIVKEFLKSDFDYFLSIDHDVVPSKNPLELVESNKDIIGLPALVYQKGELHWTLYDKDLKNSPYYKAIDMDEMKKQGAKGLINCHIVGSGAILIKREVLENIKAPFSRKWSDEGLQEFGLDFNFCKKAENKGYEIYSAIDYPCSHFKELDLIDAIKLGQKYGK